MYMDKKLILSEGQAVAAGTSQNIIDQGKNRNAYSELFLVVLLEEGKALTAAQSLSVSVESCDTEAGTYVKVATFEAEKLKTQAVAQRIPFGLKRYIRLTYAVSGTPTGNLTAALVMDVKI